MKYTVTSSLVMLGVRFKCCHFLPTFSTTFGEILLFLQLPDFPASGNPFTNFESSSIPIRNREMSSKNRSNEYKQEMHD